MKACHLLAPIAGSDNAAIVEVIGSVAVGAGRNTGTVHLERIAAQWQRVGVEAVGALAVVGVERLRGGEAISHNDRAVQTKDELSGLLPLLVLGIEDNLTAVALIVGKHEILRPTL